MQKLLLDALQSYSERLAASKSENTILNYVSDIGIFFAYLESKKVYAAAKLRPFHIEDFFGYSRTAGKSVNTIYRYSMSLKSFFKYLKKIGIVKENFFEEIEPLKEEFVPGYTPTMADMKKLLEQPDVELFEGLRDKAILELIYSSGLRASELCNLNLCDITPTQVTIIQGKGGKTRCIPITKDAGFWVFQYISDYHNEQDGPLFVTGKGQRVYPQLLRLIVARYSKMAGIRHLCPHALRHACATHLMEKGANIKMIKDLLGHSCISTTQRYMNLTCTSMQEMFHSFHNRE